MKREQQSQFREKLVEEKNRVNKLLSEIKINGVYSNNELRQELSAYDNHPSDLGEEMADAQKEMAIRSNELSIMRKIDDALNKIDEGTYGNCKMCGNEINNERLNFLPYAEYCIKCQKDLNSIKPREINDRCVEEEVLGKPFGYGYNDFTDKVQFDAEDSYQCVESFNRLENIDEFYESDSMYVEEVESISNEQYKRQLTD